MTHGPLSWRELVERDKQKSEDARGQIKRAAMPVQAEPVAELRAEITRLTEALRAAEERERVLREALVQHNDRLRSAAAVAARDGRETNWLSFRGQVRYTLTEYHELVKESRAELKRIADE